MKYSLIIIAALTGSYAYSNPAQENSQTRLQPTGQEISMKNVEPAARVWKLHSLNDDKSCSLDTDIEASIANGKSFDLPAECNNLIPGLSGSARLVAANDGYDLVGTDNSPIVRFGSGEIEGFESFFPEHIDLRIEPASES